MWKNIIIFLSLIALPIVGLYMFSTPTWYYSRDEFGFEEYFPHVKLLGLQVPLYIYEVVLQAIYFFVRSLPLVLLIVILFKCVKPVIRGEKKLWQNLLSIIVIFVMAVIYYLIVFYVFSDAFTEKVNSERTIFPLWYLYWKSFINFMVPLGIAIFGFLLTSLLLIVAKAQSSSKTWPLYAVGVVYTGLIFFIIFSFFSPVENRCEALPDKMAMYNVLNNQCEVGFVGCARPEPWYKVGGCPMPCVGSGCELLDRKYHNL